MRYSKYFISILSAVTLIACSNDDLIDGSSTEPVYDATLSLAIQGENGVLQSPNGLRTKANESTSNHPDFIKRLTIAVYQGQNVVAVKDSTNAAGVYGIEDIKVPAGAVSLQVFANLEGETYTTTSTFPSSLDLENEKNGNLKMNSGALNYTLAPGHNYIGKVDNPVGTVITNDSIKLTRYVSRVHLSGLTFNLSDNFKEGVESATFQLDTLFFANVKAQSLLTASNGNYEAADATWSYGACADSLGQYKAVTEGLELKNWLNYDFKTAPSYKNYFFDNNYNYIEGLALDRNVVLNWSVTTPSKTYSHVADKNNFGADGYVNESSDENNPKLLVVRGRIAVTYRSGQTDTSPNGYYAVVINDPATKQRYEGM